MRKVYSIAVVAILGLVFQSCGLKGPLRLPERAKPVIETRVEPSAPANVPAPDQPKEP